MNSTKNTIIIILVIIILGGGLYYALGKNNRAVEVPVDVPVEQPNGNNGNNTNNPNNPPAANQMITVTSPIEGSTVDATNGFTVTGQAVGGWYFEATAPVTVYAKDGKTLAKSYIQAEGEWMTTNPVAFKGEIQPFVTAGATEGYIIFENSNPSDNEGFRRSLRVNVMFAPQETQTIKLYFGNSIINPNAADCAKVFSVTRVVPKTSSIGALAIRTMFQGPTNAEVALGYTSAFGNNGGSALKSLDIKNGVATADFSYLPSGGSCLVGEARAQIEQTLKQFSTVKNVKILLNGSQAEALQP